MEVWTKRLFQIILQNLELVLHQRKKSLSYNILVTSEAVSAAASAGSMLQLISMKVTFPKD